MTYSSLADAHATYLHRAHSSSKPIETPKVNTLKRAYFVRFRLKAGYRLKAGFAISYFEKSDKAV